MSRMFETTRYSARFRKLAESLDYRQLVYAAERLYGTGGFGNSLAFCLAIEGAGGIIVPEKAQYIRTILMELSLMQENLLRLAAVAEHMRYENLSMRCWTEREKVLEILDDLTGNRMFLSMCVPGGVKRDLNKGILDETMDEVKVIIQKAEAILDTFSEEKTVSRRLKGIGFISKEAAQGSGVTGSAAKGSGFAVDRRELGEYGAYRALGYEPVVEYSCDCYGRCLVKAREIIQSGKLVMSAAGSIPEGSTRAEMQPVVDGEWITRIEQADGMETYYIRGRNSAYLEDVGIRTASESNEKVMYRIENCPPESEALVRLTLGIDDCLRER